MSDTEKSDATALRDEIYRLKAKRSELSVEKSEVQAKLTKIKNLIRTSGLMPREKFKACCDSQNQYSAKIGKLDEQLGKLKLQIQKLCDQDHFSSFAHIGRNLPRIAEHQHALGKEQIQELVFLREKYQQFSADHTRVSSMRTMAAEFANALNPIIRSAVNQKP